jgi:hypothetical protein
MEWKSTALKLVEATLQVVPIKGVWESANILAPGATRENLLAVLQSP